MATKTSQDYEWSANNAIELSDDNLGGNTEAARTYAIQAVAYATLASAAATREAAEHG